MFVSSSPFKIAESGSIRHSNNAGFLAFTTSQRAFIKDLFELCEAAYECREQGLPPLLIFVGLQNGFEGSRNTFSGQRRIHLLPPEEWIAWKWQVAEIYKSK